MATVFMPLPDRDFDLTESAVPWRALTDAGHEVVFGTETGAQAACDPSLIEGVPFDSLKATPDAIEHYRAMAESPAFRSPALWDALDDADALWLTGGHGPGMKQYLGSAALQASLAASTIFIQIV